MRIKLSKAEMQSLEQLLSVVLEYKPPTTGEKLLIAILIKLYQKIAKALVVSQKQYSIKFDDATALAFCEAFAKMRFYPTDHSHNLVLKLTNQFKQHYA